MKTTITILMIILLIGCEKENIITEKRNPVHVGQWQIKSTCNNFRYYVNTSMHAEGFYVNSDTTIELFSNQIYRIHYIDTNVVSIDSVLMADTLNHINYNYTNVREHITLFGEQEITDVLPCTIY